MTRQDIEATGLSARETRALFRNCRSYWHGYGHAQRLDAGMTLYSAGAQHPQLNGVMWIGEGDLPARITEARRRLAGVPWRWWVGPDSAPGTLDALLAQGGALVGTVPVMAAPTDGLAELPGPAALEIEEVPATADLAEWVGAYAPAMGVAPSDLALMTAAEKARTDAPGTLVRFAGRLDGRIVGVSELLLAHGVAGIYLVATAGEHRRRGIGAALTAAAVRRGRERGAALATLQASPIGQHLYRRLGFVEVAQYQLVSLPRPA